jgi:hypothetical protein
MKAILEFDLDEWFDRKAHKRAISATDLYIAVKEFDDILRNMQKYGRLIDPGQEIAMPEGLHKITEKESVVLHALVDYIRSSLNDRIFANDVNMDDLE